MAYDILSSCSTLYLYKCVVLPHLEIILINQGIDSLDILPKFLFYPYIYCIYYIHNCHTVNNLAFSLVPIDIKSNL